MSMNNGSEIATNSTETMAKLIALENRTGYSEFLTLFWFFK